MISHPQLPTKITPNEHQIQDYFKLVHFVIHRHFHQHLDAYEYADLFQHGCYGLVLAIRRYNPSRASFSTYAIPSIYGAISNWVNRQKDKRAGVLIKSIDAPVVDTDDNDPLSILDMSPTYDDHTRIYAEEFLDNLQARERKIAQMRLVGMTHKEIAQCVGVSQAHVARLLKKIAVALRAYVESGEMA